MTKTESCALAADVRALMLAHARALAMLPDKKWRAAQAKANNLYRHIVAALAPLAKGGIESLPSLTSSNESLALQSGDSSVEKIKIKPPALLSKSLASDGIEFSQEEAIALAVGTWRLLYAHERAIGFIPQQEQRTESNTAEELFHRMFWHVLKPLKQHGLKIVYFEGKIYETNRPVHAVNADDFEDDEPLVVSETMEPALVQTESGRVLYFAKVLLARANNAPTIGE